MLSLEFTRSFKLLFSGDLSPSSFVFSSFVVQFSRSVLLPALADSLYSISHRVRFVKRFFKTFLSFLFPRTRFPLRLLPAVFLTACLLYHCALRLSRGFFNFFQVFYLFSLRLRALVTSLSRACIYSITLFLSCQLFFVFFYSPFLIFAVLHTFDNFLLRFLYMRCFTRFSRFLPPIYIYMCGVFSPILHLVIIRGLCYFQHSERRTRRQTRFQSIYTNPLQAG